MVVFEVSEHEAFSHLDYRCCCRLHLGYHWYLTLHSAVQHSEPVSNTRCGTVYVDEECFHFYKSMKNGKCIKTTHWQTNSYPLGQVGGDDIYKEDWLEKPPTLVQ